MKQLFLVCMTTVCLLSFQTIQGQQVVPAQGAQMIPAQKMQMTLAQPDGIAFRELSFANALKMAKEENKLLFVDCFTTWCGPCRMLSKVVFKDSLVADYFNRFFFYINTTIRIIFCKRQKPCIRHRVFNSFNIICI